MVGRAPHMRTSSYIPQLGSSLFSTPSSEGIKGARNSGTTKGSVYEGNAQTYALAWAPGESDNGFKEGLVAFGTCVEEVSGNKLQLLSLATKSYNSTTGTASTVELHKTAESWVNYPPTKIMFDPNTSTEKSGKLLASSSDSLRIWQCPSESEIIEVAKLQTKRSDDAAPLTSFDWNSHSSSLVITSSIDTTVTAWDIVSQQPKSQLIAHDKEVFDVGFIRNSTNSFASVGADGSCRLFDLRNLQHSTIIYESSNRRMSGSNANDGSTPLLRLSCNYVDTNLLAIIHYDSNIVHILDIRNPGVPILDLNCHAGPINAISWAPGFRNVLASAGDDCQVLVWDTNSATDTSMFSPNSGKSLTRQISEPSLIWSSDLEVNNLAWSPKGEFVAITTGRLVQVLGL